MIKHLANSLVKTASVKQEYLRSRMDEDYSSFAESLDQKPIEAFSKGFAAGAILPTILSLANSGVLDPVQNANKNKTLERIHHGTLALELSGLPKDKAEEMATALDTAVRRTGIRGKSGMALDQNFRNGVKSLISQQLATGQPTMDALKGYTYKASDSMFSGPKTRKVQDTPDLLKRFPNNEKKLEFLNALADDVIEKRMPSLNSGTSSIISDKDYADILEIGKSRAKKTNQVFSPSKQTMSRILGHFRKSSLIPGVAGLVGGAGAVAALRNRQKKFNELQERVNARR